MFESKVLISDVDMYPLRTNDIKFNVNPLTPNQITICLADTKKTNFKITILVDYNKMFHIH